MDDDFDMDDDILMAVASQADHRLEATKPSAEHLHCLQTHFGHSAFRPKQWDIIRSIIEEKRDNCVIMPTGYGKSLCFQYPAVYTKGMTLVVSPLISLMQDQVNALSVANISACFLGSAQTDKNIVNQVIAGDFRMVYASPEYITNEFGKQLLKKLESKLTLVAIDESHCISAYGHAFRSDYRKLGSIRDVIPSVPILAVTATATPHVRDDIITSLHLKNPQSVSMGFDRPNIHFSFRSKTKNTWDDLKPFVVNFRGSVIIYVLTKAGTEDVARVLQRNGIKCEIYHAGLAMSKRRNVLDDFIKDRLKIIVATVAFGMGIDKPDVRFVIHYGASKNIESYYQEVGRAGRDGQPSKAITFYEKADFGLHEWFLNENHENQSERVIQHLREIGNKMRDFCYTSMCRRKCLLNYFGSDSSHIKPRSNCCDNCDNGSSRITLIDKYEGIDDDGNYDFTDNAYLLLKAMQITSKVAVAISVLRGSSEKQALDFQRNKEIYGAGKIWPKEYWSLLVDQLKRSDYITMKKLQLPYRPIQIISPKGVAWLQSTPRQSLILKAKPEMYAYFKKKRKVTLNKALVPSVSENPAAKMPKPQAKEPSQSRSKPQTQTSAPAQDMDYQREMELSDKHLEEILLGIRTVLAENSDIMPFSVASNNAIQQMVAMKPVSIKEFKSYAIDGFSLAKIDKFASVFVDGIGMFMDNEFNMNNLLQTYPLTKKESKFSPSEIQQLIKLMGENQSISNICMKMNRFDSAVINEIVILIRSGTLVTKTHLKHLVGATEELLKHISSNITDNDFANLDNISVVKEKFAENPHITENMLVLVLNYLKVRQFLSAINVPYFDIDENRLVNGKALLGSKAIESTEIYKKSATSSKIDEEDGLEDLLNVLEKNNDLSMHLNCSRITGSVSSSQSAEPTLQANNTETHTINNNYDVKTETVPSKILHSSQTINQKNDVNRFEAVPPAKMVNASMKATAKKRAAPASRCAIQFLSDSDSDDDKNDNKQPETKRKSPQWQTTKKPTTNTSTNTKQPNAVRKRTFF